MLTNSNKCFHIFTNVTKLSSSGQLRMQLNILEFCEIHKPNWQIKTMLVNQSKEESSQGQKRLGLL